jgi:filamentous hemagglutinin family protein
MNHVYKLIWSRALNALVPVPETVSTLGRGGRSRARRGRQGAVGAGGRALAGTLTITLGAFAPLAAPVAAWALPQGGQVTSGQAGISQTGAAMTVTQTSQSAIINWQSFGVAGNESVTFNQPSSSSVVLNRVLGSDASDIYGQINANGQVFLVNPNGIYFAPGAQVSVGGLVASTLDVSDADFTAGNYNFTGSSTASVVNDGSITTSPGGTVAFIAPVVDNEGSISTPGGTTALGAGSAVNMTMAGNSLVSFQVSAAAVNAQVHNGGAIAAKGGAVIMSAQAQDAVLQTVVNNTGVVQAQGVSDNGGVITLLGGDSGTVQDSGTLDASSSGATGGSVTVSGQNVQVTGTAQIAAGGATGGGTVTIGGGATPATTTTVAAGAVVDASATENGNGGTISVTSDPTNAAAQTQVAGTLTATGGAYGGNGGEIETSGPTLDTTGIAINAAAPQGTAGQWLLDPTMVEITSNTGASGTTTSGSSPEVISGTTTSYISPATIDAALDGGTSVTVETSGLANSGAFDVWVVSPIVKNAGGAATLTLQAANSVYVGAPISSTSGALNVNLYAGNNGGSLTGTGAVLLAANITTNGGNINFGTNQTHYNSLTGLTALAGGDVYVDSQLQQGGGGSATNQLVTLNTGSATGGGNVNIYGQTVIANPSGFTINSASSGTGTDGNVYFAGTVDSGNTFQYVSASDTWYQAYAAAASGTGANTGDTYLATLPSSVLNAVASFATNYSQAWLGGERLMAPTVTGSPSTATNQGALDNKWYWVTGPLGLVVNSSSPTGFGTAFFTQNGSTTSDYPTGGTAIGGDYTNWNPGTPEPNNSSGSNLTPAGASEWTMQFVGTAGQWNDLNPTSNRLAYVKETNLAASPLTVTSGTGTITLGAGVGTNSPLLSFNATGNVIDLPETPTLNTTNGTTVNGQVEVYNGDGYVSTELLTIAAASSAQSYGTTPVTDLPVTYTVQGDSAADAPPTNVTAASESWTVAPTASSSPGIYGESVSGSTWTGGGSNPYTFIYVNGALTINPATLYYTANTASSTYGGSIASVSGSVTGLVNGNTLSSVTSGAASFSTTATSSSNAGSYAINGTGLTVTSSDYTLAQAPGNSTAYTIDPATLYYTAGTASSDYGADIATLSGSVTGLVNGNSLASVTSGTAAYSTTATAASDVGTYAITGSGLTLTSGNYTLAQASGNSTAYTIDPATLYYTADTASSTYGGDIAPLSGDVTGFMNGDTLESVTSGTPAYSTTATTASDVGSYAVTGTGLTLTSSDYTLAQAPGNSTAYTIDPATLYYTANSGSSTYGAPIATLSGTVTGFENGDTLESVTSGTPAYSTTATTTSDVGNYAITGTGLTLTSGNYTLAQASGNSTAYTIDPATLYYTANTASSTYGAPIATVSGTVTGFMNGDTLDSVSTGTASFSTTATTTSDVGSYSITGTGLTVTDPDYVLAQDSGNSTAYTIDPATLYYTANTASSTYGADIAPLSGTVTGFMNGDTLETTTSGAPVYSTTATTTSDVGSYSITGTGLAVTDPDYVLAQAPDNSTSYTIDPATLYYTAAAASSAYGAPVASMTGTVTGFMNGDTLETTTTGAPVYSTAATTSSDVGTYTITGSGLTVTDPDYVLAQAGDNSTSYTITPAMLTLSGFTGVSRAYDGTTTVALTGTPDFTGLVDGQTLTLVNASTGTLSGADAGTQTVSTDISLADGTGLAEDYTLVQPDIAPVTITPATLTVSGLAGTNYTYNGSTTDTLAGTAVLNGLIDGQTLTLENDTTGTLANADAGSEAVSTDIALANGTGLAADYLLVQPALGPVTVTPATLTVTGTTVTTKAFDGTTAATVSGGTLRGVVPGDVVTLTQTGAFTSIEPGIDQVIITDTLGGVNAGNYTLSEPQDVFATINAPPVSPTAVEQTGLTTQTNTTVAAGAINPTAALGSSLPAVTLGVEQGGVNADGATGSDSSVISPYLLQSTFTTGDTSDSGVTAQNSAL